MAARETPNLEVRVQILYHLPQGSRLAGEIAPLIRWRSLVQIQPALPMEQWVSGLNQLIANQPYSNRVPKVQILPAPPDRGIVQLGRTLALGARGRRFKSCFPYQKNENNVRIVLTLLY